MANKINHLLKNIKKFFYFYKNIILNSNFFNTIKFILVTWKNLFVDLWLLFITLIYNVFNLTVGRLIWRAACLLDELKSYINKENLMLKKKLKDAVNSFFNWVEFIFFYNHFTFFMVVLAADCFINNYNILTQTLLFIHDLYEGCELNILHYSGAIALLLMFFFTGAAKFFGVVSDIRVVTFNISLFLFALIISIVINYDQRVSTFVISLDAVQSGSVAVNPNKWNIFCFGYDGLSLSFLLLTTFIFPIVILAAWDRIAVRATFFYFNIIFLELLIIGAFLALDLFLFFIFFEFIFVPMSVIIFIWGGRQRKIKASSYLLMYAVFSSIFFLIGIFYVQDICQTTNLFQIMDNLNKFSVKQARALWVLFFVPFAIKVPMFPFHIWSPEAHVEAPTAGSIVLASVLLKLGGYAMIRFLFTIFREASMFFSPVVCLLALLSMVYASLVAFRQTDFKKVIAYSSIIHMNLAILGLFTFNINAIYGAIMLMLGHGIVSGALFFLVGALYDRHHTRTILYYGGLAQVMPLFTGFFFFFILANFGFPCSLSFLGEFIVFLGLYDKLGLLICIIVGFCSVLGTYLNIQLFTSLCYGTSNSDCGAVYQDLTTKELGILISLTTGAVFTLIFHAPLSALLSEGTAIYIHLFI